MHALLRPVAALPLAAALAVGMPAALLIGAGTLVVPSAAHAQRAAAPARPQIERLEIGSDAGLAPGAELELELRLFGTPRGTASVRISAAKTINVVLKESPAGSGEYVAYYTIKRADRLAAGQAVRSTLRRGKLTNSASYSIPASAGGGTPLPAARCASTALPPRPCPARRRARNGCSPCRARRVRKPVLTSTALPPTCTDGRRRWQLQLSVHAGRRAGLALRRGRDRQPRRPQRRGAPARDAAPRRVMAGQAAA